MNPFVWLLLTLIDLFRYVLIATIILSWLESFNIINYNSPVVRQIDNALRSITDPVLAPIRRVLPPMGGLDFSPIVLFILLAFVQRYIYYYIL
jgi:YggT family protein